MNSRIFLSLAIALFVLGIASNARAANATQDAERELVRLINQERGKRGLQSLQMDERLTEAARVHSEQMAQRKQLSHRLPNEERLQDRLGKTGVPFDAVAENVAHSGSAGDAHTELMNSPGHRANILSAKYNAVGVGVMERDGHLYITQDFANRLPEYNASEIENRVLAAFNKLRKENRQAAIRRARADHLREFACEQDITANGALRRFSGANSAVVFTAADPDDLPTQMRNMASQSSADSMALGACAPSHTRSSYAVFTVVALFYR